MMSIPCPYCGPRNETEFTFGGEAHIARPPADCSDARWAEYLYLRDNTKGIHSERWCHTKGCGQWFNAFRNTSTHEFLKVYDAREPAPQSGDRGSGT